MPKPYRHIPDRRFLQVIGGAVGVGLLLGGAGGLAQHIVPPRWVDPYVFATLILAPCAAGLAGWLYPRPGVAALAAYEMALGLAVGSALAHGGAEPMSMLSVLTLGGSVLCAVSCPAAFFAGLTSVFADQPPPAHCTACGYGLNNVVDARECPECGVEILPGQYARFVAGRFQPARPPKRVARHPAPGAGAEVVAVVGESVSRSPRSTP